MRHRAIQQPPFSCEKRAQCEKSTIIQRAQIRLYDYRVRAVHAGCRADVRKEYGVKMFFDLVAVEGKQGPTRGFAAQVSREERWRGKERNMKCTRSLEAPQSHEAQPFGLGVGRRSGCSCAGGGYGELWVGFKGRTKLPTREASGLAGPRGAAALLRSAGLPAFTQSALRFLAKMTASAGPGQPQPDRLLHECH